MKLFNIELSQDLLEIMKRLKTEKNIKIRNILLKDKNKILKYLGLNEDLEKLESEKTSNLDLDELTNYIDSNQMYNARLKKFKIFYINHENLSLLTKIFIEKPKNKLNNTYKKITSYGGLKYFKGDSCYLGVTMYIKSLDKNYIKICRKKLLSDYTTKIHELAHARVNSMCGDYSNCFSEVYPLFMELIFSDHLKKNGLIREAYNIKLSLLLQLRRTLIELKEELFDYSIRSKENSFDNFIFEYKYNTSRDIVVAFYLYEKYILNPNETQIKIDYFLLNLNKLSEDKLLDILDLDKTIFEDISKIVYTMYDRLQMSSRELIQKNRIK